MAEMGAQKIKTDWEIIMDKIAVLIPCYNEAQTIKKVVEDAKAALPEAVVYVYDNNSADGTDEIAREAGAVVRYEYQQGKGNVIRRMFREIEAECYIMVDGDDTYPSEQCPGNGGCRFKEKCGHGSGGQAFFHLFFGKQASLPQYGKFTGTCQHQQAVSV